MTNPKIKVGQIYEIADRPLMQKEFYTTYPEDVPPEGTKITITQASGNSVVYKPGLLKNNEHGAQHLSYFQNMVSSKALRLVPTFKVGDKFAINNYQAIKEVSYQDLGKYRPKGTLITITHIDDHDIKYEPGLLNCNDSGILSDYHFKHLVQKDGLRPINCPLAIEVTGDRMVFIQGATTKKEDLESLMERIPQAIEALTKQKYIVTPTPSGRYAIVESDTRRPCEREVDGVTLDLTYNSKEQAEEDCKVLNNVDQDEEGGSQWF